MTASFTNFPAVHSIIAMRKMVMVHTLGVYSFHSKKSKQSALKLTCEVLVVNLELLPSLENLRWLFGFLKNG